MRSQVEGKFCEFFENWMSQLEEYAQLLVNAKREKSHADNEVNYETLVNKLTQHHKDYYTAKWAGAHEDVLVFFTPAWLSPLENAYSWMTGWKPSTIFRLVDTFKCPQAPGSSDQTTLAANLSDEQLGKIRSLRGRIRVEEDKVEREMERVQVSLADRKMVGLARLVTSIMNGERPPSPHIDGMVDAALKELMIGLERVMKMADCVRLKTLKGILDALSPIQSVDFLAASAMLLIQMRKWGKEREKNRSMNQNESDEI